MKGKERRNRIVLAITFSIVVFFILLVTQFFVSIIVFNLIRFEIVDVQLHKGEGVKIFLFATAIMSLSVGTIFSFVMSRIPLRPIYKVIDAMDKLSSGDYSTRLRLRGPMLTKQVEESFNKLASELENTEMIRSDFVNNFSHEFKTPIVSIAGFAKLLKCGDLSEEEKSEYVEVIEEESKRLANMATNVLNLTKVENQAILTDIEKINCSEQIRTCVLLLERGWMKKNIELDLSFDEHYINANEELLKQVWINLIDNAIKFAPVNGKIAIEIEEKNESIVVKIINNGEMIPSKDIDRIFNKFYQGDVSHSTKGNGIGLAIVKRVVELHNGSVTVSSNEIKTSFIVKLPKNV